MNDFLEAKRLGLSLGDYQRQRLETRRAEPRKKWIYIGAPECFALELACKRLNAAFTGQCYVVGSVLKRADWRDVDVRLMMDDEEFLKLFPDVSPRLERTWEFDSRWLLLTTTISDWLKQQTGLPVDFQFQPTTFANKRHSGIRNPIGIEYSKEP